jgi:AcrR family transcriptional regulator
MGGLVVNPIESPCKFHEFACEGGRLQSDKPKRVRRDPATTRALILDATERIMVDEGYAAVSSRRVAQELQLNGATIHYYYPTTDDLFIALHQRMRERRAHAFEDVLRSEQGLRALWDFHASDSHSALGVEFLALANHRKAIGDVLARLTNQDRDAQAQALEEHALSTSIDPRGLSPKALTIIMVALSRTLANEERLGIKEGHDDVRAFVDRLLDRYG